MGIQPEIRVKRTQGKPVFPMTGPSSIVQKGLIYLLILHRDQWIIQNYAVSTALTLIETRLSLCIPSCIHKSLGDLYHLLARRPINILPPFSDKGNSVVLPKVWCHSQKALNKLTFLHSKDRTIYNKKVEYSDL